MADIYEILSLADSVAETLAQLREEDRIFWLDEYAREPDTFAESTKYGRTDWRYWVEDSSDPEPLAPQVLAVLQLTGRFVPELQASSGARRKIATVRPEQIRALAGAVRDAIQNPRPAGPPAPATTTPQAAPVASPADTGPVTGTSTPTTTTVPSTSTSSTVPDGPASGTPPGTPTPTTMPSSTTTSTGTAASSTTSTAVPTTTAPPSTSTTTTTTQPPATSTTSTTVPAATSTTSPSTTVPPAGGGSTRESAFPTNGSPSGAATDPASTGSADTSEARQRTALRNSAGWVYEYLGYNSASPNSVSPDPLLMETWNTYNPDDQVGSLDELYVKLANRWDEMVISVVEAVRTGEDAAIDLRIALPGGRSQLITATQYAAARNYVHGGAFTTPELVTIVRWADMAGLRDATGQVAWQPAIAVLLAHGVRDPKPSDINRMESSDAETTGIQQRTVAGESDYVRTFKPQSVRTALKPLIAFREGMRQYGGNSGYAFLHSVDPQLALKLSTTAPDKWARADIVRANQWLIRGGVVNEDTNLGRAGYATEGDVVLDQSVYSGRTPSAGGGAMRSMPDPVAVRQAAKDMWKQFFVSDPSDEQVAQLAAQISSAISSAPINQSVDVEARVREMLLSNGLYRELYSRMPKGMTEGEYQNQFRQAAQTMLGAQAADPSVIRAGMRTGSYQTSIGAAASSKAAFDNSTFMGRLAAAAQVVSENT